MNGLRGTTEIYAYKEEEKYDWVWSENVKMLGHIQGEVVAEEGAVRGGFRVGWAPGVGVEGGNRSYP